MSESARKSSTALVHPPGPHGPTPASVLGAPLTALPGIGPAMARRFGERGLFTIEDLLWFIPRRYDDTRALVSLADVVKAVRDGDPDGVRMTFRGHVLTCRMQRRGRKRWLDVRLGDVEVPAAYEQAPQILIRWFNAYASMAERFARGNALVVSGRVNKRGMHAEMINPDVLSVVTRTGAVIASEDPIIPRYGDVPGVPAKKLRAACRAALDLAGSGIVGGLPMALQQALGMVGLREALERLHRPPASTSVGAVRNMSAHRSKWHRRLAFEELFILGLAVGMRRVARRSDAGHACPRAEQHARAFAQALPFSLTGAQERAIAAISSDLSRSVPMNRLLQGDVGSGKTAVAFAAAHQVIQAGKQVAFMAPTEILAEQHFATVSGLCERLGIVCALLTASVPAAGQRSVRRATRQGYANLVVGTHSLLSDKIEFSDLGLVIIDEQHRFGVAQRVVLREKGEGAAPSSGAPAGAKVPHLLVMTATPIPRTLALTAYGDLDVALIDEMPPGRVPATTEVLAGPQGRARAHAIVRARLDAGERVFVVCPSIEPGDGDTRSPGADAVGTAQRLSHTFAPYRVGLVHGRMKQTERDDAMLRFRNGDVHVLVATTVIEVGVDIPQATVMVVLHAHMFGLAQLHQLRGRVGRGGGVSHCLLMTRGELTPEAERRLAVMARTSDGFRIAEEDLAIRGPGEVLGVKQAGLPRLRFGDLRQHADLLFEARAAADQLLASDPQLSRPEHAATRQALSSRTAGLQVFGAESG